MKEKVCINNILWGDDVTGQSSEGLQCVRKHDGNVTSEYYNYGNMMYSLLPTIFRSLFKYYMLYYSTVVSVRLHICISNQWHSISTYVNEHAFFLPQMKEVNVEMAQCGGAIKHNAQQPISVIPPSLFDVLQTIWSDGSVDHMAALWWYED